MSDLELASNDELIHELLKRSTFRGVVIMQRENFRGPDSHEWRWAARNCDVMMVLRDMIDKLPGEFSQE
jgi:hypothetical protein